MYDTPTRSQFIDLRARGWSYRKIAQHTGIAKNTLLRWGQEYQADIERLKHDYLTPVATVEGPAQESYFHNLEGHPPAEPHTPTRTRSGCRRRASALMRSFRRLLKSPLVRVAVRCAIFRR